ncbi:MAG: polysaccharide pyruvyl transferase family protein [Candidatus Aenigmarchaeota archaeon]|nr:polysaccharide pyruvyl transferase family protein [Candidatus Aenigmarchaeota archaeon]
MNNKKVGLLALVGKRYKNHVGSVLQAYALQSVIEKLGFECEIIDFEPPIDIKEILAENLMKSIITRGFKWTFLIGLGLIPRLKKRVKSYRIFKKTYLNLTPRAFKNEEDLESLNYDVYVVGSDVVWSPKHRSKALKIYLLDFVKNKKKISYAASVWHPIPNRLYPIYKNLLRYFDFLSVREKTSVRYLKRCGIKINPEIVLDPTLLLSKEEWKKISKPPEKVIEKPYIIFYDVHHAKGLLSEVFSIAKKKRVNVVTESPFLIEPKNPKVYSFYTYSPAEFLWLIENAEYVITTSLHGTIFSVLFQKPFYSIKPAADPDNKIVDFLETMGLEDRFVQNPKDLKHLSFDNDINWKAAKKKLERKINTSIRFLKKALR